MLRRNASRILSVIGLVWAAGLAGSGLADSRHVLTNDRSSPSLTSIPDGGAKQDTLYLIGGPLEDGDFEDVFGAPSWDGWTPIDLTAATASHWQQSDYGAADLDPTTPGNHAWWCGTLDYGSCGAGDPEGGYGNNWDEYLRYTIVVPPAAKADTLEVRLTASYKKDTEDCRLDPITHDLICPDYFAVETTTDTATDPPARELVDPAVGDVDQLHFFLSGDYYSEIYLTFHFHSDDRWSDEDCIVPSDGAVRIDNIRVYLNGVLHNGHVETCEPGDPSLWLPVVPDGVGNFGAVHVGLSGTETCRENMTPQVGFVDDGIVEPATGGSPCWTWCYGPYGYVVNAWGGLAGPNRTLWNEVWSPVAAVPTSGDHDAFVLSYERFHHAPLGTGSAGIFPEWRIRSTASSSAADIANAPWVSRDFVTYGGPELSRRTEVVSDLLVPGAQYVQVALGVRELGYLWGWTGLDATPAPYYDNVQLITFPLPGPAMATREIDLAQDGFPEQGFVDLASLGSNHVRFDMAGDVATASPAYLAGDSILCDAVAVRDGTMLDGPPRLYYRLKTLPLFEPYVYYPTSGWVEGRQVSYPDSIPWHFSFDLPDSNFLFPGSVLHYYFWAKDTGGVGAVATIPADTTGFSDLSGASPYDELFRVRGLPSVADPAGDQPPVLWWDDSGRGPERGRWILALRNLGLVEGVDYDCYRTLAADAGQGNGLGGRATATLLSGYETLLYTSGTQSRFTIMPDDDQVVLTTWFAHGNKNALFTGDDLAFDLATNGPTFLAAVLGVQHEMQNLSSAIDGQTAPLVLPSTGSPVFSADLAGGWIACGSCPDLARFDGVTPLSPTVAAAAFTDPAGAAAGYPYPATTYRSDPTYGNRCVYVPYGLSHVLTPANVTPPYAPLSARARLLGDVLTHFGVPISGLPVGVPAAPRFEVFRNYPNPFNPSTVFAVRLSAPGKVLMQVFDVRGRLVRTLVDGVLPAGPRKVVWDGTDGRGRTTAAGVYFCRASAFGTTRTFKMMIVK
jgi:hypothetical protein